MTSEATSSPGGQPSVTLTNGYDSVGNRTTLADNLASAGLTTFTYDAVNRLTNIAASYGGTAGPVIGFGYDAANRLTSLSRTIGGTGTAVNSAYAYDSANRLTTITHGVAGGSTLASYTYLYDVASRLLAQSNAEGLTSYSYDPTDQLINTWGSATASYTYDNNGNRTMSGYSTGTNNELTSGAGYTYTYDNIGNLISKTQTSTGDVWTYSYDYHNNLTGVVEQSSVGSVLMQATYTYDALGRRIGVDETVAGTETKTWSVYDGMNVYADFDASGTLLERYVDGPAIDEVLARTSASGMTAWYLTDDQGSVRDIVNTSGTVIDHLAYDSFGNVTSESSPSNGDRFKYNGMQFDQALNEYYDNARYYDPVTGRFLSPDPTGFAAGDPNLYRFVGNGPVDWIDPTGTVAIAPWRSNDGTPPPGGYWGGWFNPGNWHRAIYTGDPNAPDQYYDGALGLDGGAAGGGAGTSYNENKGWAHTAFELAGQVRVIGALGHGVNAVLYSLEGEDAEATKSVIKGAATAIGQISKAPDLSTSTKVAFKGIEIAAAGVNAVDAVEAAGTAIDEFKKGNYFNAGLSTLAALADAFGAGTALRSFFTSCFAAGTPILTPDGPRPIESLRPGEWVYSQPEDSPESRPMPMRILETMTNHSPLFLLRIGEYEIRTTPEHPFWVRGKGWVDAQELIAGDQLLSDDGRWITLGSVAGPLGLATVYNIQVEEYHTYFVGGNDWEFSIWAHNAPNCWTAFLKATKGQFKGKNWIDEAKKAYKESKLAVPKAPNSVIAKMGHTTPWDQMSAAQRRAFQHSYSRHAQELGLPAGVLQSRDQLCKNR